MPTRWLVLALALVACEGDPDRGGLTDAAASGGPICAFDDSTDAPSALPLTPGTAVTGALCPVEDQDWYRLTVPAAHGLVTVRLAMDAPVSPVEPTWTLRARAGAAAGAVVASPAAAEVGRPLASTHCVGAGDFDLVVRDQGDDAQDRRSHYVLDVTTAPDPDPSEPDNGPDRARLIEGGTPVSGRIACRGDEDWYALDVGDRQLVRFSLTAPVGTWQPAIRVVDEDANVLLSLNNPAGAREPTALRRAVAVPAAGRVFLVVSDDDGSDGDAEHGYELTAEASSEFDDNEPNDTAASATGTAALTCGPDWTDWAIFQGSIGRVGDTDWFRIPLEGCGQGLIEADVVLPTNDLTPAEAWELQRSLQPSLAVVRGHEDSPCAADEECRALNLSCQDGWGCAGYFNVCLADNRCAGATACLQEGHCGAFRVERHLEAQAVPAEPAAPPPPLQARISAPLERRTAIYLRLSDFGGDAEAPTRLYTLRVRVRRDPDRNEPSNVYTPGPLRGDTVAVQTRFATRNTVVPVHDCTQAARPDAGVVDAGPPETPAPATPPPDAAPRDAAPRDAAPRDAAPVDAAPVDAAPVDAAPVAAALADAAPMPKEGEPELLVPGCCGPSDWIEGALSYEFDQDWYAYAHPCPGEDCMVRIRYAVDGGPADQLWQVFRRDELWFDPIVPVEELAMSPARQGSFGGVEADDACFYAYRGHTGSADAPYWYSLAIRDLLPTADWSPDQTYRFCIEKVAAGCSAPPCQLYDDGCGLPR
ncbi:MAG: hypothetical protein R3F60_29940 [bacterium]